MRTTTNYFLLNLSVADLLMSSLNCMFNFIYMLNSDWPFGSVYCSVNNFMGNVTVATSVFTLVAISFNRYVEHQRIHCRDFTILLLSFCILVFFVCILFYFSVNIGCAILLFLVFHSFANGWFT